MKKIIYKPLLNIFGFVCVGLNKYTGRKLPLELAVGAQLCVNEVFRQHLSWV
ncbi:hypothetical protein [Thiopseudomonas acetoxidans]|uniref:Uncharacterized protein n=1 Tax=Thiopseudomonas acetoxidans TaxID=3041622 RepID=A0ABT7STW9_9GAMM|nr:hypothetical protein [Thiopseudomonas sp. CY1220]MDM7858959.1 hypothetical protein [Thiopseudomonas sp. CY1220]